MTLKGDNVLVTKGANGKRKWGEEEGDCGYIRLERRESPWPFVPKFWLPEDARVRTLRERRAHRQPREAAAAREEGQVRPGRHRLSLLQPRARAIAREHRSVSEPSVSVAVDQCAGRVC